MGAGEPGSRGAGEQGSRGAGKREGRPPAVVGQVAVKKIRLADVSRWISERLRLITYRLGCRCMYIE